MNSFQDHQEALKEQGLSEAWTKKHKTKMDDARKSANEICSILGKNSLTKNQLSQALQPLRSGLEILNAKQEEAESASQEMEKKKHNNKIDTLIADKKEASLKNLSVKQLEAMKM